MHHLHVDNETEQSNTDSLMCNVGPLSPRHQCWMWIWLSDSGTQSGATFLPFGRGVDQEDIWPATDQPQSPSTLMLGGKGGPSMGRTVPCKSFKPWTVVVQLFFHPQYPLKIPVCLGRIDVHTGVYKHIPPNVHNNLHTDLHGHPYVQAHGCPYGRR